MKMKSPSGRKSITGKSPGRPRSKSGGRKIKKEAHQVLTRSKSRSKKESRSRSRARAKSKSPGPRTRSRTRRSSSRSRASSKSKKREYTPVTVTTETSDTPDMSNVSDQIHVFDTRKMSVLLRSVFQDDYIQNSVYKDTMKRSLSRDISQDRNSFTCRRYPSLLRERSEDKQMDGIVKDVPTTTLSEFKVPEIPKKDFGYGLSIPDWIKAASVILLLPPFVVLLHLDCTKDQCTLSKFHIHQNLNLYFNLQSVLIVVCFVAGQTLLSLLPIGRKVGGPLGLNGTLMYRCNGLLSTFISVGVIAMLWHYNFPVTSVCENITSLITASAIFAYFIGFVLFIRGGKVPVTALNFIGINKNRFHQFVIGREINPLLFGMINVKTVLLRVCFNALVTMNMLFFLKSYERGYELSHTLTTCIGLSTFLIIDFYWFEDSFPTTFEAMYEGTGCYLTLTYMLFPFFPTLITKYIVEHKIEVPVYGIAAIVMLFLVGFFIYRASNLQKAAFRKNPLNPALAHFETIPTSRGKKLLVAGWWGFVRHPNYLGTILLHWVWSSSAGFNHVVPYIIPLTMTLILINRARRVDAHCRDRYYVAWDEYCNRVPHRIIPYVY